MPPLEPEWKTRKERIDKRLTAFASAWKIIPFRADLNPADLDGCAVEEFPTDHGPADYALFVRGQFLGVIEGKRVGVNPQNVLEQAKRYSRGATVHGGDNWNGFRVDYEAVAIKSDVRMNGAFLKAGEEVGLIDPVTGREHRDELEDERAFPSEEIERRITAPQSNR